MQIVRKANAESVNEPLVEGIMVGTGTGRAAAMVFHGRVIEEKTK